MLFKETLFLSNCDAVRGLSPEELAKRFMLGVVFAEGVAVTPSLLLDNPALIGVLESRAIRTWYHEEGAGTLSIRAPGMEGGLCMVDFFDRLPDHHILQRMAGRTKASLTAGEADAIRADMAKIDQWMGTFRPVIRPLGLEPASLSTAILGQKTFGHWQGLGGATGDAVAALAERARDLGSRSAWYAACDALLGEAADRFKLEVVDASYHGLFVGPGDALAMDRIRVLDVLPAFALKTAVQVRSLRQEIKHIETALTVFDLIVAAGSGQLLKFVTDQAIDYIQDKMKEKGGEWVERRSWFGLYPKLLSRIGLELR